MIDTSGPAFPVAPDTEAGHAAAFKGMSLRDYFAAQALAGIIAHRSTWVAMAKKGWDEKVVAKITYDFADAMLEARQETPNG